MRRIENVQMTPEAAQMPAHECGEMSLTYAA